jgi:hypothetical protein
LSTQQQLELLDFYLMLEKYQQIYFGAVADFK